MDFGEMFDSVVEESQKIKVGICESCGKNIQPIEINHPITGELKKVIPDCGCHWKREEVVRKEAEEHERKVRIAKLFSISNLGEKLASVSFDNVQSVPGNEECVAACKRYVERFEQYGGKSLLLYGKAGNGKSTLAAAVMNELKATGKSVVFQSVPELLDRIRNTFDSQNKETQSQIMKALLEADLLILDDIGTEKVTDWVIDRLFGIIDGRYRQQKPIFYTSNLDVRSLASQFDEHGKIYDRIIETSYYFQNKAESFRRKSAVERVKDNDFWKT